MAQVPLRIAEVLGLVPSLNWAPLKYVPGWKNGFLISGKIKPFEILGVVGVASLLDLRAPLAIDQSGRLLNPTDIPLNPRVAINHLAADLEFEFELWIPGDGSHPQLYVISPRISRNTFPDHVHLHYHEHPLRPPGYATAACFYPPHAQLWDAVHGPLIVPLTWAVSWMAAHAIWARTGKWLSTPTEHKMNEIWRRYGAKGTECQCGSGKPMRFCCLPGWLVQERKVFEAQKVRSGTTCVFRPIRHPNMAARGTPSSGHELGLF